MNMVDKDLYFEIVAFLEECGGAYKPIKPYQCHRVLECLDLGQYLLQRNTEGRISQFCVYWKVKETDFDLVQKFKRPPDITSGNVVFSVDYASRDGFRGVMQMFFSDLPVLEPEITAGCYEHKGRFVVYDRTDNVSCPWRLRR